MKKVCTIGSATQDMFIIYEGADTLHLHQKNNDCTYMLLPQGTKIDVPDIKYALGGGATNTAVGLNKLGFSVETFFKTGDDLAGHYIRDALTEQNIGISHCSIDSIYDTALSIVIPSIENDHAAFCYRAANREQHKEDFPITLLKELDLIFIGPLGGNSKELLPFLAPAASNAGVTVAINPSMKQLTEDPEQFIQALQHVDTLLINALESGYLMQALLKESRPPHFSFISSDEPTLLTPYVSFKDLHFTIKDVVQQIIACGPQTIVITNGAEGVYVATAEKLYFHPSIKTSQVYTLGAGDAFSSAFVGAQTLGIPISEALLYGIINASSVIQYPDTKQGLLTLDAIKKRALDIGKSGLQEYDF